MPWSDTHRGGRSIAAITLVVMHGQQHFGILSHCARSRLPKETKGMQNMVHESVYEYINWILWYSWPSWLQERHQRVFLRKAQLRYIYTARERRRILYQSKNLLRWQMTLQRYNLGQPPTLTGCNKPWTSCSISQWIYAILLWNVVSSS